MPIKSVKDWKPISTRAASRLHADMRLAAHHVGRRGHLGRFDGRHFECPSAGGRFRRHGRRRFRIRSRADNHRHRNRLAEHRRRQSEKCH